MGLVLRQNGDEDYIRLGVFEFPWKNWWGCDAASDVEFDRYKEEVTWLNNSR